MNPLADDTQGYSHCYATDVPVLLWSRLSATVDDSNSLYSSLCLFHKALKTYLLSEII